MIPLDILAKAIVIHFRSYFELWGRYGFWFSLILSSSMFLQLQNSGFARQELFYFIILTFPILSLVVSFGKTFEFSAKYNKADEVEWLIGTKESPPWFFPLVPIINMAWLVSFIAFVYVDTRLIIESFSNEGPTVLILLVNCILVGQVLWAAFKEVSKHE